MTCDPPNTEPKLTKTMLLVVVHMCRSGFRPGPNFVGRFAIVVSARKIRGGETLLNY
jgi:hypothetical protein